MCIISIIMITLCIPNQMEIANAAEGDMTDSDARVILEEKSGDNWVECKTDEQGNLTEPLNIFPKSEDKSYDISPGDSREYRFRLTNHLGYKANCQLRLHAYVTAKDGSVTTEHDDEYPISYDLRNSTKDESKNVLGGETNPFDCSDDTIVYKEQIEDGQNMEYLLIWNFEQVDSTFIGGKYNLDFEVWYEQAIDPEPDPDPTPTPDPDPTPTPDPNPTPTPNPNPTPTPDDSNNSGDNNNNNDNNTGDKDNNNASDNDNNNANDNGNNANDNSSNSNNNSSTTNTSYSGSGKYGTISAIKKKVNTSDMTTPVIYVAVMILSLGLILLIKSRNAE